MAGYFKNVDRWGNQIPNTEAPDFNPTPISYTPTASGNTQNLNSFVIDPNGDLYFIDKDGQSFKINTSNPLDVLTTVQPTPTATGNTTNLNSVFKDAAGDTWVVDYKGDAIKAGSSQTITTVTNTKTGNKIATYTNEAGVAVDINETITSVSAFSISGNVITLTYVDEAGASNTKTLNVPADVVTTLTNTKTGNKIGTYTNESGVAVDINETITVLGDLTYNTTTSLLSIPYTDEAGVVTTKTVTIPSLNVLTTTQPTPTATGNTTNLNSAFKDAAGDTWIVDANGDAVKAGSSQTITTITNTKLGNKIATYTNEAGAVVDINETITTMQTNADGSFTFMNESGTSTTIPVVPCKSYLETETFTATAGQTTFTLLAAAQGDVRISRNGATLADNAATAAGNVVTYLPSANNNEVLLAGDRIEITYVYTICSSTAVSVPDGSETKVTAAAGSDITVTGSGTISSPYVINSNLSRIGDFAQLAVPADQSVGSGAILNFNTTVASNGSWVVPGVGQITLKAGGIYEVETAIYVTGTVGTSFITYGIFNGGTMLGTQAHVVPVTHGTAAQGNQPVAKAFVVASVDTTLTVKCIQASSAFTLEGGALNGTNFTNFFTAKCIGII